MEVMEEVNLGGFQLYIKRNSNTYLRMVCTASSGNYALYNVPQQSDPLFQKIDLKFLVPVGQ